jgi:predicted HAD superfamily hydrolase
MSLECQLERQFLQAIPDTRKLIDNARRKGLKIAFISDMYLSSDFIRQCLKEHGLWQSGDRCYVSCEHNAEKITGELFKKVLQSENLSPTSIVHDGNNW